MDNYTLFFESLFLLDFILKFFLQYTPHDRIVPELDISNTAKRYVQTTMLLDLFPLVPWNLIMRFKYGRLFYLIKSTRMPKSIAMLDQASFMGFVLRIQKKVLEKKISLNSEIAEDIHNDHNKIYILLMVKYTFMTARLILIIFFISYFLGTFFFIFS